LCLIPCMGMMTSRLVFNHNCDPSVTNVFCHRAPPRTHRCLRRARHCAVARPGLRRPHVRPHFVRGLSSRATPPRRSLAGRSKSAGQEFADRPIGFASISKALLVFAADGNAENFARRRWTEIRHLLGVRLRALRRLGAPLRVLWLTLSDAASCALIATSRLVFVFPPRRLLTRRLGARWAAQRPCWRPLTSSALLVSPRTAMPRTSRTVAIPRSTESLATPRLPLAVRQPGVRGCAQRPRRQLQAPAASRAQIFGHMASARPRRTIPRALRLPQVT
jgi:hypothetical protein